MSVFVKTTVLRKYHNAEKNNNQRALLIMSFFLICALIITIRLYKLQVQDNDYYLALAFGQHEIFRQLYPERGTIFIKDSKGGPNGEARHYAAALNKEMRLLYAVPNDVGDPEAIMEALKEVFEMRELSDDELAAEKSRLDSLTAEVAYVEQFVGRDAENEERNLRFLNENKPLLQTLQEQYEKDLAAQQIIDDWRIKLNKTADPYEPLRHLLTDEQVAALTAYNFEGLHFAPEETRFYPEKNIGSQLLGFVGKQAENNIMRGSYGLEGCYDKVLAGEPGFLRSETDGFGRLIAFADQDFRAAENGADLYLTIEKSIQYYTCEELDKYLMLAGAERGAALVMDPRNGAILAWCEAPDYDPNEYNKVEDLNLFRAYNSQDAYEPGSVFKPITMAAALDTGRVDPFSTYYDTGEVKVADRTIRNSDLQAHGVRTMTQVLEESLNTGTVYAAKKVGHEEFRRYVQAFGFGAPTGVDLCHETAGNIKALEGNRDIYLATASFGQGITVTTLQLARAYAAIANGGNLPEPYVVEKIIDSGGQVVSQKSEKITGQAISAETAKNLGGMLVSVVKNGHATKAGIDGYLVAGKTGTAQVADLQRGGYGADTIHTFAGFAPFNNPRFVIVVRLDKVRNARFAEGFALPLFRNIAKFIIDFYEIPPEVKY